MMLQPESTAYDLFDGNEYPVTPLPTETGKQAHRSMGKVDVQLTAST
ncbi:MAG: hypothetical protein GY758_24150 [Fuerstiella sp.]|nr:hypothetical protein [Fuerstiella sp.]MCP4511699.1 hypothetical protein [Fuerstiella sp.]